MEEVKQMEEVASVVDNSNKQVLLMEEDEETTREDEQPKLIAMDSYFDVSSGNNNDSKDLRMPKARNRIR
jgi:hypothetical protein